MSEENKEAIQQQESVSSDVIAFCALFARILMRCLREKNPHVRGLLSPISIRGTRDRRNP